MVLCTVPTYDLWESHSFISFSKNEVYYYCNGKYVSFLRMVSLNSVTKIFYNEKNYSNLQPFV